MRIAVIPERYGRVFSPCASIRLAPFFDRVRGLADTQVRYLLPEEVEAWRPDIVVWHRVALPTAAAVDTLALVIKRIGAQAFYDLDDNLLDLEGHGEAEAYLPKIEAVRRSLRIADEVWCSTPLLVERVQRETDARVTLLPNALDPVLWGAPPAPDEVTSTAALRLLYMGTRTHDADFELLSDAMRLCESQAPGRVELTLVGVHSAPVHAAPWLRTLAMPDHLGASYPAFVHWFRTLRGFDLGVAPLLSSPFNDCKSPIKVLDYAAIGLPALASGMPAYSHSLGAGTDCLRCENTAEAWSDALLEASHNRAGLRPIALNAAALVSPERFAQALAERSARLGIDARGQSNCSGPAGPCR